MSNALAAAAVAARAGHDRRRDRRRRSPRRGPRSRWRMEVTERADGVTVVNDAYNANPDSMRAALRGARRDGPARRPAHLGGARRDAELGDAAPRRARRGRPARRPARTSTGWSRSARAPRGMHAGRHHEGSWGEESVHVPDAAAARRRCCAAELRAGRRRAGEGVPVGRAGARRAGLLGTSPPTAPEDAAREGRSSLAAASALVPDAVRHPAAASSFLVRTGYGQFIRDDGPPRTTPSAARRPWAAPSSSAATAARLRRRARSPPADADDRPAVCCVLFLMTGLGLVGFLDDYIKISKQRSLGSAGRREDGRPAASSASPSRVLALQFPNARGQHAGVDPLSFVRDIGSTRARPGRLVRRSGRCS